MTATVYPTQAATDAFLAAVQAVAGAVGDAEAPEDRTLPYPVVYPLGSSAFDGSLDPAGIQSDAWPTWQITYVGAGRAQTDLLRDDVRAALLGSTLSVAGWNVGAVQLLDEQPARRDDDVQPPLFYAVDRYRAYLTPRS